VRFFGEIWGETVEFVIFFGRCRLWADGICDIFFSSKFVNFFSSDCRLWLWDDGICQCFAMD
jgi:hypothetical protein